MPCQKALRDTAAMRYNITLLRKISAIHLGAETRPPLLYADHNGWLRREQQHMPVRTLPLRELRHADGNLRDTRRGLGEEPIRSEPRRRRTRLCILPQAHIHGVMIFGDIPVDVVQTSIPHLDINLAPEECGKEFDKGRYHLGTGATSKTRQYTMAKDPGGNVPMRRPTALVLCLHDPLQYHKELVTMGAGKKQPDTTDEIVHVQGHEVCPSPYTL